MQDLRIYGLTPGGAVAVSETIPDMSIDELRDLAGRKLDLCHEVEVWQGPVRVLRLRRGG